MSRRRFLLGLLAPIFLGTLTYVLFERWVHHAWENLAADKIARHSTYLYAFLLFWLAIFPIWRFLLSQRLARRGRPLWWAKVPGTLTLFGLVFLSGAVVGEMGGFSLAGHPNFVQYSTATLALGPIALGFLAGIALTIECLRPDNVQDVADVFD